MLFFQFIFAIVMTYFTWAVAYQFTFAFAAKFKAQKQIPTQTTTKKATSFAVIIPSYKEDKVILETAAAALLQEYPSDLYDVFVVADQLEEATLTTLRNLPIHVEEVFFKKSSKAKALHQVLSKIDKNAYDSVVILDADNIMKTNFLQQMDANFKMGHQAVQGCRAAKNDNTAMAILDGASEAANNTILAAGPNALNLSGRLAGSGMAFKLELFRDVMQDVHAISGFDKELELRLTQKEIFLHYNQDAVVYDEKVSNTKNFTRQRGRWLAAQYQHFSNFIGPAIKDLVQKGNYDFFNKAIQMALPPRLILPIFLAIATVLSIVFAWNAIFWSALFALNIMTYVLALPTDFWTIKNMKAFYLLPKALFATFQSLLLIPEAKKRFLHTTHGS